MEGSEQAEGRRRRPVTHCVTARNALVGQMKVALVGQMDLPVTELIDPCFRTRKTTRRQLHRRVPKTTRGHIHTTHTKSL